MKRSQINAILRDGEAFLHERQFHLPPFARWTPADWAAKGPEALEIVSNGLGWDVTDLGQDDFERCGLFLFTLRNGRPEDLGKPHGKPYAEKVLIIGVDQVCPLHFHWRKMEDIINRGGGELVMQLYNATPTEELDDGDVRVQIDGVWCEFKANEEVVLSPGESITLPPRLYHRFWARGARVLAGEVSLVNDDQADNRFYEPMGRFPAIEEDEAPLYLLVGDYAKFYNPC